MKYQFRQDGQVNAAVSKSLTDNPQLPEEYAFLADNVFRCYCHCLSVFKNQQSDPGPVLDAIPSLFASMIAELVCSLYSPDQYEQAVEMATEIVKTVAANTIPAVTGAFELGRMARPTPPPAPAAH